ncbi:GGDEF domain-containing protein [Paenarthrobacter nitroguajacolicus]|uniref:GGDEF domain-containing protein n=1 Tax=Paenarthrobacter nitroguajacolicus TaxID=211146 RepID=UPI0015BF251A|nr:GGDEF domain-containing protein [Paenarthrobacter nitroguajacolicus]NWL33737.1 GGDEF domain-containing protein [Paenarthrobacter nitroguajacolicus]
MIAVSMQEGAVVLDPFSVRMVLGAVILTLIVLSCVSSRRLRPPFTVWWRASLCLFFAGNCAFLLNGTSLLAWASPPGKALVVAGAFSVWAGARKLRDRKVSAWHLAPAPLITYVASLTDTAESSIWSGGLVYLGLTAAGLGMSGAELWFAKSTHSRATKFLALTAALTSLYYLGRAITFVLEGPDGNSYRTYFGYAPAAVVHLILLVSLSFTMNALSNNHLITKLRERAERDHLTGLLNRGAFLGLAAKELAGPASQRGGALILADLDYFKAVNDEHGHAAGDAALCAFAEACTASVRSTDLVGRYGGEEFILFLPGATQQRAEAIASEISHRLSAMEDPDGLPFPTVSYGVTSTGIEAPDLDFMIKVADAALYSAKAQGRNRVVGADPVEISLPEFHQGP